MKKQLLNVLVVFAFLLVGLNPAKAQGVYNICSISTTTDTSGTLFDTGGPSAGYQVNENCTLLVQPSCATSITLNFVSFESESNFDYLYVYDGTTTADPLLVTANGPALPTPTTVTASSGAMLIVWRSDVSITYAGFEVNWTSVIAPSSPPTAGFTANTLTPPLNVNTQFTDTSAGGPTTWLWDFGDSDTSHRQNPMHTYAAPGTYIVTLIAFTCNESDTITHTVVVQAAPQISVAQTGFTANAACGDSIAFPLDISNIAGGQLVYTADGSNVGALQVLAMTYGADLFREYPNTITALNQSFSNYTLTTTATTNPGTLSGLLNGKNVLLIPEQETGNTAVWNNLAPVIKQFLNNGGSVIFIGSFSSESDYLFSSGIFTGSFAQDESAIFTSTCTVVDPASPLAIGLGVNTFPPPSATYSMVFTNSDIVQVVKAGTNDVVAYRYYGAGKAIFIAFDYYDITTENSKILANAVQWGGINALPSWISLSMVSDTVNAGATSTVVVSFQTTGLPAGTYYANLGVASNDPSNPLVNLPCTLTVSGNPIVGLSDQCLNFGSIMQSTTMNDTFQVINNGCDTLFVSSITSNSAQFTVSSGFSYLIPGAYGDVVVTFGSGTLGTFTGTISVLNNDIDTSVCLSGSTFPAPVVNTSASVVSQSLPACGNIGTQTFDIINNGPSGSIMNFTLGNLPPWVSASPTSGTVLPGTPQTITLTFVTGTLAGGLQTASLNISSNDPVTPNKVVTCSLTVGNNPCMDYTYTSNTCTGFSQFTTTSINTPTTYHWDFGDGDTSNVANPSHGFPANASYIVTVIGCNPDGCDTVTQTVNSIVTGPVATSCYPATLTYCCGIGITNFHCGILGIHEIFKVSGDAVDGYKDYTCTDTVTLLTNYPYDITARTGFTYPEAFYAWLDFNGDGSLDPVNELIHSDTALTNHAGTFIIPGNAVVGQPLRLRISSDYVGTGGAAPSPCADLQFGQVEDYSVFVSFYDGVSNLVNDIAFSVYPNPFDRSSNIEYNLKNTSNVTVEVYNMMGAKVQSFAKEESQIAGKHSYQFVGQSAGVYYVKISANGKTAVQKVIKM